MKQRELLMKQIDREQSYCNSQEVGTEEYEKSFKRLSQLRGELAELEKYESETEIKNRELTDTKKDRRVKNILEGVKIVGTGIIMPCIGFVVVTAFEKDDSFTSSLKKVVDSFVPKRLN